MGKASSEVDAYIARCPKSVQAKLREVRKIIRNTVPDANEVISYSMPGYSYGGYSYKGMFVWFGLQSGHIGLYLRPPTIWNHRKELANYKTTKSAVHLPFNKKIPAPLIKKLVKASVKAMKKAG
ncbi:MAG: iron chaperone [Candidatus Micrarchaeales archaeon]